MLFIDNKYSRIYFRIIEQARTRTLVGYRERHHIIPNCFYKQSNKTGWLDGDPDTLDNLVDLTAREHFICHRLLPKFTEDKAAYKMSFALKRFLFSKNHKDFINSCNYEYIKKFNSEQMKGKPCSPETKEKIRQGNLNRGPDSEEALKNKRAAAARRKGQPRVMSEEWKEKIAEVNKARVWTDESREKLRQHNLGKTNWSQKGIPQEKLTCPHCGLTGGKSAVKHWHFDKCRQAPANQVLAL